MSIPFPKPDTAHVYLLRCDPNGSKSAHMLVLIDLLDKSNDVHVSGLIVHATIDAEDRSYPNRTEVSLEPWSFSRTQVQVIYIGHLNNCKYLTDPALIPSYVIKYSVIISISVLFSQLIYFVHHTVSCYLWTNCKSMCIDRYATDVHFSIGK